MIKKSDTTTSGSMTGWDAVTRSTPFPGHPLFDTAPLLQSQIQHLNQYPTLVQFLRRCPGGALEDWRYGAEFLRRYANKPNTYAQYRGDLQRFLNYLWCIEGKTLPTVCGDDIEGFLAFCQQPPDAWQSRARYAGFRMRYEDHWANPQWRPFLATDGHRASTTTTVARVVVRKFLSDLSHAGYLKDARYLIESPEGPLPSSPRTHDHASNQQTASVNALTDSEWAFLLRHLEASAEQRPGLERTLFVVVLLKSLFLRVSNLAVMSRPHAGGDCYPVMGDFSSRYWRGDTLWFLRVYGLRDKVRWVPVPSNVWDYVKRYRRSQNLPECPAPGERQPLVPSKKGANTAISKRQLERLIHDAMTSAAFALEAQGRSREARKFRDLAGSTDALRHTGALHSLAEGCPVHRLSRWIGHETIDLTISTYRLQGFRDVFPP